VIGAIVFEESDRAIGCLEGDRGSGGSGRSCKVGGAIAICCWRAIAL